MPIASVGNMFENGLNMFKSSNNAKYWLLLMIALVIPVTIILLYNYSTSIMSLFGFETKSQVKEELITTRAELDAIRSQTNLITEEARIEIESALLTSDLASNAKQRDDNISREFDRIIADNEKRIMELSDGYVFEPSVPVSSPSNADITAVTKTDNNEVAQPAIAHVVNSDPPRSIPLADNSNNNVNSPEELEPPTVTISKEKADKVAQSNITSIWDAYEVATA